MNYSDSYEQLEISVFDALARAKEFVDGPWIETFGDGYGEPYNPDRVVYGRLKDGREVRSVKVYK